jgi:hypothetical protein
VGREPRRGDAGIGREDRRLGEADGEPQGEQLFTPLMAWIVHHFGWHHVFTTMGALGIAFALLWGTTPR